MVELFYGDGHGGFEPTPNSPIEFAAGAKMIVAGDFNGDGIDDTAVGLLAGQAVLLLPGGRGATWGLLPAGEHPWGLAAADFNLDGRDDLVVADGGSTQATLFLTVGP